MGEEKEGGLDPKKKKILTIVGVAVVLTVFVVFGYSNMKNNDSTTTEEEQEKIASEKSSLSELPTATATKKISTQITPGTSVVVGDLDWTKNAKKETADISKNVKFNSADEEARYNSGDPCAVSGLSDNWSDPFEKTMCGMTRFVGNQIVEPLSKMACDFAGAGLASNYGSNIKSKYIDSACLIEDRK